MFCRLFLLFSALALIQLPMIPTANADTPTVGSCYLHTKAEVSAKFAKKTAIPCSQTHNVEVYFVGKWPSDTPPWKMTESSKLDLAASVCNSKNAIGRLNPAYFNYWAWFPPNKKEWRAGERWLRCDGMYVASASNPQDSSTYVYGSWKGRRL
jgi:hypothetical protein